MKKIISLLLVALLLLPVLPAMAEDVPTVEVVVSSYNNSNGQMLVTLNGTFENANVYIANLNGDKIPTYDENDDATCIIAGGASGVKTGMIDLSKLKFVEEWETFFGGDYKVIAKDESGNILGEATTKINENIVEKNERMFSNSGNNNTAQMDKFEDEKKTVYTWKNEHIGLNGFYAGDSSLDNVVTLGSTYTFDYEMLFENLDAEGNAIEEVTSNHSVTGFIYFRQPHVNAKGENTSDSPYKKSTYPGSKTPENTNFTKAYKNFKTNTWYKVKMIIDMVSVKYSGDKIIPDTMMYFYVAEKNGDSYGDYKLLFTDFDHVIEKNLVQWRFECQAKTDPGRLTFKDYSITKETPKVYWKYDDANTKFTDSKTLELSFDSDLGELTAEQVVVKNRLGQDVKIDSIVKDEINPKKYVVKFNTNVLSRTDYDVYLKYAASYNGFEAVISEEEAIDGFWKLDTITVPANELNVHTATGNDSAVNVAFNVPDGYDFTNKFAAVCWYKNHNVGAANQSESLLGFDIKCLETPIPSNHADVAFAPATTISADKAKTYIFKIDAATGKATILDFVDVEFTVAPLE